MIERDEFMEIICPLFGYVNQQERERIDDFLVECYFAGLRDIAPGHLKAAIARHIMTADDRWLPSIGKIRGIANLCRDGRRWQWQEAWGIIIQACDVFSQHDREQAERAWSMVGEELRPFVRTLGGFLNLKNADPKTLSVLQSNFRSAYENSEIEKTEQRKLPNNFQIPKVIIQHTAKALGLPDMKKPEEK